MSAENILIESDGQTVAAHATCGDYDCTLAILRAVGVSEQAAAGLRPADIDGLALDEGGATVSVVPLGESDEDVWCFACGGFIRHGLSCTCPELDGEKRDPKDLDGPHIDFAGHPALRDFQ